MTNSMARLIRTKVPLDQAADLLHEMCDRVDAGENPDVVMVTSFNDARLDLADAVDRRIAFDMWAKGAIRTLKEARDECVARANRLEMLHEKFKENTRLVIEAHPEHGQS